MQFAVVVQHGAILNKLTQETGSHGIDIPALENYASPRLAITLEALHQSLLKHISAYLCMQPRERLI